MARTPGALNSDPGTSLSHGASDIPEALKIAAAAAAAAVPFVSAASLVVKAGIAKSAAIRTAEIAPRGAEAAELDGCTGSDSSVGAAPDKLRSAGRLMICLRRGEGLRVPGRAGEAASSGG